MKPKRSPGELTWSLREVLEVGTPVGAVACQRDRVVIGGDVVFRLVAGKWLVQHRPLPDEVGRVLSIAIEPRPPYRIAVGPDTGDVVVFTDTTNATSTMGHTFTGRRGAKLAQELAWVRCGDQSSLFARTDDDFLYRMQSESWEIVELPPVRAIAQDEEGAFAALLVVDGKPSVFITYDGGESWHVRKLGVEVEAEPSAPAFLAIAGTAVAVVVGDSGVLLNRAPHTTTARPLGLDRARALAFAGPSSEAGLYIALGLKGEEPTGISLLGNDGSLLRVMDFFADDDEPYDMGRIAWDTSREALLMVSRAGLTALSPEKPKRSRAKKDPPAA